LHPSGTGPCRLQSGQPGRQGGNRQLGSSRASMDGQPKRSAATAVARRAGQNPPYSQQAVQLFVRGGDGCEDGGVYFHGTMKI